MLLIAKHLGYRENCVATGPSSQQQYSLLEKGKIDIGNEPGYQNVLMVKNLSFLYPHDIENLCMLVRKAPPIQQSALLTIYYSIWVAIGACFLLFVVVAVLGYRWSVGYALFEIAKTFLTGAFMGRLRLVLVWMSILSFFMGNTIAGSFTGFIVTPSYEKEIDTMQVVSVRCK